MAVQAATCEFPYTIGKKIIFSDQDVARVLPDHWKLISKDGYEVYIGITFGCCKIPVGPLVSANFVTNPCTTVLCMFTPAV